MREPGFGERLHHRRGRPGNDAQRRGQLPHRHEAVVRQRELRLVDVFEIVLDV